MPYSLAKVRPTSSKRGRRRATSTRFNPTCASWRANSLPMPEDAPVTSPQGPNVFFSMRFICMLLQCVSDGCSSWSILPDQSRTGTLIIPEPFHGKLNFDHRLISFGGLERLDEDFPSGPCQLKMVMLHPDSQSAIVGNVVCDANVNDGGHGFNRRYGASGHHPTIGQPNGLQSVAAQQKTHLHIDVL